jgi:hypothetical protein
MYLTIMEGVFYDESIEGIMILTDEGDVYSIRDDVGISIWNRLQDNRLTIEQIIRGIRDEFIISESDYVEEDARAFINQLLSTGVIAECKVNC